METDQIGIVTGQIHSCPYLDTIRYHCYSARAVLANTPHTLACCASATVLGCCLSSSLFFFFGVENQPVK